MSKPNYGQYVSINHFKQSVDGKRFYLRVRFINPQNAPAFTEAYQQSQNCRLVCQHISYVSGDALYEVIFNK